MPTKKMVSTEISYIYGLNSSRNIEEFRYIGYTCKPNDRLVDHLKESKQLKYHRHKWIQKELSDGYKINMEIFGCYKEVDIQNKEMEYIKLFKSLGARLTNGNNGGKGGTSPSKEVREKIRLSKIGNKWNIGRKRSKECIEKGAAKIRGIPKSKEHKEKLKISNTGKIAVNRKVNEDQVVKMFYLYNKGENMIDIVNLMNLPKSTILNILWSKSYEEIKKKNNLNLIKRENGIKKFNRNKCMS